MSGQRAGAGRNAAERFPGPRSAGGMEPEPALLQERKPGKDLL